MTTKNFNLDYSNPGLLRTHTPYLLKKCPGYGWFLFGRNHTPLGLATEDLKNVMTIPLSAKEEKALRKVAVSSDDDAIYFYGGDGSGPWDSDENLDAYMKRLRVLYQCTFFKKDTLIPWYADEDGPGSHRLDIPNRENLNNRFYKEDIKWRKKEDSLVQS